MSEARSTERRAGQVREAQARIIDAALDLFSRHGVGGTSLGMIAKQLGVTKAAIYHQYRTKDEIVAAVAESELRRLDAVVATAEAQPSKEAATTSLLEGMVDLAIARGPRVSTMLNDPVIGRMFEPHPLFRDVMARLERLLAGGDTNPLSSIQTAVLIAAISGAVLHPFSADIDDDVLRAQLLRLAHRFLDLPD